MAESSLSPEGVRTRGCIPGVGRPPCSRTAICLIRHCQAMKCLFISSSPTRFMTRRNPWADHARACAVAPDGEEYRGIPSRFAERRDKVQSRRAQVVLALRRGTAVGKADTRGYADLSARYAVLIFGEDL